MTPEEAGELAVQNMRASMETERARLRDLIQSSWTWQGQGRHGCGFCGAIVHSQPLHLDWHLKNLQ